MLAVISSGFPRGIESIDWIMKSLFKTLKSIAFGQNVHEVLKKFGNSIFSHLFVHILLFAADNNFADVFCIVFHE